MEYNLQETTFYQSHLLGVDEYVDGKHRVRNVTIRDLLNEMGLIDQVDLISMHDYLMWCGIMMVVMVVIFTLTTFMTKIQV